MKIGEGFGKKAFFTPFRGGAICNKLADETFFQGRNNIDQFESTGDPEHLRFSRYYYFWFFSRLVGRR